jgi:hypothetical protein
MKSAIYLTVGLILGFAAALAAAHYWNERASVAVAKTDRADVQADVKPTVTSYYLCKWNPGTRESQLQISGDGSGAKTILFPYKGGSDLYRIVEANDLHYFAVEESPAAPEAFASLDIDRLSGEMVFTNRASTAALQLGLDLCENRISLEQCKHRMASLSDCLVLPDACARFRGGNNISMRSRFDCRSVERRF